MAGNARVGTVLVCDTTGSVNADKVRVVGVKYIGAASGTASIQDVASGTNLWEAAGGTATVFENVYFNSSKGLYVTVTNNAKLYIYLAPE